MPEAEVIPSKRTAGAAVARAAAGVMAATLVSKFLGFGREAALAAVFGARVAHRDFPLLSAAGYTPAKRAKLRSMVAEPCQAW